MGPGGCGCFTRRVYEDAFFYCTDPEHSYLFVTCLVRVVVFGSCGCICTCSNWEGEEKLVYL